MGLPPNVRHVLYVFIVVAGGAVHALIPLAPAWSWLVGVAQVLAVLGAVFTDAPGTAAKMAAAVRFARAGVGMLLLVAIAHSASACTPAQQALVTQIEQTVLADLAAGKTRAQILQDVGALVAGQPGADVALIVADAITFLIDAGVIPPNILPMAKEMLHQLPARAVSP